MLAALLLAATVTTTALPQTVYLERSDSAQIVNFDLVVENPTDEPLDVDEVQVSVYDRSRQLVLRKFLDGNGTRPSIRTIDVKEVPAKGKAIVFNPFERFDRDLDLASLQFDLKLSSKDGERRFTSSVTVQPKPYAGKAELILPVAGRLLVYDGHDFYAHHRRWDYTIPMLQQLGFRTNFMRYSYDFVVVNAAGAMSEGDEKKNENWFGFGRDIRAVAPGTIAAVNDDQADDRNFDPASIAEHGTMRVWGNYVVVDHGGGEFAMYGHIKNGSSRVKVGQKVKRGEVLAAIGASGSSMFPHLHFELQTGAGTDVEGLPSTFADFVRVRGSKRVPVKTGIVETGEIVSSLPEP